MTKTKIRKSGKPASDNPDKKWCLQWQTESMRAPAFWYYRTRKLAREARDRMKGGKRRNA